MRHWSIFFVLFLAAAAQAQQTSASQAAQPVPSSQAQAAVTNISPKPGQVVVTGTVPDESSKAAILAKLRALYGQDMVTDQITIGSVVLPANWNNSVQKIISPDLKQISRGQLKVDGTNVSVTGEVGNEAQRQQITSNIATGLTSSYTVNNGLRVVASEQGMLDATLGNRIIEFETGKASLTASGKAILDELAVPLIKLKGKKLEVIGHTDNQGLRSSNVALSAARAEAVKAYLAGKGVMADNINTSGLGPDRPVASNDTVEGRARNRRIEFRVAQ
jgi:OOP family OmpA-OmpF porin